MFLFFNLFTDLFLPYKYITPIGHMKVTDHVSVLFDLIQSIGNL